MLEFSKGLSSRALTALAELEARTVRSDGGRLKLEWGTLRSRSGDAVEDLLWWDGDQLIGFLGLYALGGPAVELAGMVDPAWRRRGIATALLDAAMALCHERSLSPVLLVTPRETVSGREFATARGGVLEHSEHALVLHGPPIEGPTDPAVTLRDAQPADGAAVVRIMRAAFDWVPPDLAERLGTDSSRTLLIELGGSAVGCLRVSLEAGVGGVYGFAVEPDWQGRGIGRDVLRRVCVQLRAAGAERVGLEVAVGNEHALGLYTSLGFTRVTTEDYFQLPPR